MADFEEQNQGASELLSKLEEIGKLGAESAVNFRSMSRELGKSAASAENFQTNFKLAQATTTSLAKGAAALAKVNAKDLTNKKKAADFAKQAEANSKTLLSLQRQRGNAQDLLLHATGEERVELLELLNTLYKAEDEARGLEEAFGEVTKENEKLNSNTKFFDTIGSTLSKIPIIGDIFGDGFSKAAENIREIEAEGGGIFEKINAGAKAFDNIILTTLTTSLFSADSSTTNLAKQLAISKDSARDLRANFNAIAIDSGTAALNSQNLTEAFIQLGDEVGAVSGFNAEQIEQQGRLTNLVGLQAGEAAKLSEFGILNGETTRSQTTDILEQVKILEQETGIRLDGRKILAEVANISGQLGAQYGYNVQQLSRAVVQAQRLGLTLEDTKNIAGNLLDFESSITSELEAELLIGKNLNLEQARLLALQGDSAGAAAELAKQFGSAEEFSQLNVIQQESLAKAMGMSTDQLADSIRKQQVLSSLGVESIKQLEKQGRLDELRGDANGELLLQQYEQQSASEKFANAVTKIQAAFGNLMEGSLGTVVDAMAGLADSAGLVYGMMGLMATVSLARTVGSLATMAMTMTGIAASSITTAAAWTFGIGLAAIAAGMIYMSNQHKKAKKAMQTEDDAIIPPGYGDRIISSPKGSIALNNQDTLVAGTNLGGGKSDNRKMEALLEKLVMQNNKKPQLSPVGLYEVQ